jgi:hypothetical protein
MSAAMPPIGVVANVGGALMSPIAEKFGVRPPTAQGEGEGFIGALVMSVTGNQTPGTTLR